MSTTFAVIVYFNFISSILVSSHSFPDYTANSFLEIETSQTYDACFKLPLFKSRLLFGHRRRSDRINGFVTFYINSQNWYPDFRWGVQWGNINSSSSLYDSYDSKGKLEKKYLPTDGLYEKFDGYWVDLNQENGELKFGQRGVSNPIIAHKFVSSSGYEGDFFSHYSFGGHGHFRWIIEKESRYVVGETNDQAIDKCGSFFPLQSSKIYFSIMFTTKQSSHCSALSFVNTAQVNANSSNLAFVFCKSTYGVKAWLGNSYPIEMKLEKNGTIVSHIQSYGFWIEINQDVSLVRLGRFSNSTPLIEYSYAGLFNSNFFSLFCFTGFTQFTLLTETGELEEMV